MQKYKKLNGQRVYIVSLSNIETFGFFSNSCNSRSWGGPSRSCSTSIRIFVLVLASALISFHAHLYILHASSLHDLVTLNSYRL